MFKYHLQTNLWFHSTLISSEEVNQSFKKWKERLKSQTHMDSAAWFQNNLASGVYKHEESEEAVLLFCGLIK